MAYTGDENAEGTGTGGGDNAEQEGGGGFWSGLFNAVGNGVGNLVNPAQTSSWDTQAHKDWVTEWVTQQGLDWMDVNFYGHRQGQFDASRWAWGAYLVENRMYPFDGDPDYARVVEHMHNYAREKGLPAPGTAGYGTPVQPSGEQPSESGPGQLVRDGVFIMVWPWQRGAFQVAMWQHWLIWLLLFVVLPYVVYRIWRSMKKKKKKKTATKATTKRG